MQEGLEELQCCLVEMLKEFRDFTNAHDLQFFLVGGSALGAYRHQGFIPWDDDVDIAMMRPDFEKMERLMEQQGNRLGELLYSPVENHVIPEAPVGHLYDLSHAGAGYENTAKIDIHPIDGVPKHKFLRKVQKISSLIYYLSEYRHPVKNKGKKIRAVSKVIIALTPAFMFRLYMRLTKKIITAWDVAQSEDICSLFGMVGYEQEVMPKSYLMPLKKSRFGTEEFWVPGDTHNYLKRLYGEYEKLPPGEKRHPAHSIHLMYRK